MSVGERTNTQTPKNRHRDRQRQTQIQTHTTKYTELAHYNNISFIRPLYEIPDSMNLFDYLAYNVSLEFLTLNNKNRYTVYTLGLRGTSKIVENKTKADGVGISVTSP